VVGWLFVLAHFTNTLCFNVKRQPHSISPLPTLLTFASTVQSKQGQQQNKGTSKYIKSTGAQYQWWRACFYKTMATFLAVLANVKAMSRLTFFSVSSTHAALTRGPWGARIFSKQHILNSDGAEIPEAHRQQVWGRGGLSKDVKSMEESLMSFPYLCKQKDWNAGGCLSTGRRWRRYGSLNRILITGQR